MRVLTEPMYAFKKVWSVPGTVSFTRWHARRALIVCLYLPVGTRVVGPNMNLSGDNTVKCRADRAVVVAIFDTDGRRLPANTVGYSDHSVPVRGKSVYTKYKVGATMKPRSPFNNTDAVCASGIHFFETFRLAANYNL